MDHKFIVCAAALAAQAAFAQGTPPEAPRPPELLAQAGPMRHEMLFIAGSQLDRERVIANAPYCADAVHESVQVLADGNRIVQKQTSRQCRDGQGRTRQEIASPRGGRQVYLRDPVAHESWMLDADTKQAVRLDAMRMHGNVDPGMMDRLRDWAREFRERWQSKGADGAPGRTAMVNDGNGERRIVIREIRGGEGAGAAPVPPLPPVPHPGMAQMSLHTRLIGPRGPGTTNLLPAETIEGLKADGSRTTWTIEAGRIGNEKPIQIVNEVWTSPELGITVRSRDVDPLVGENNFRIQNVVRGEPDAQLFKVPADYRKVEPKFAMPPVPPLPPVSPSAPVPPQPPQPPAKP